MALRSVSTYGDRATTNTVRSIVFDNTEIKGVVGKGGMMQMEITVLTVPLILNTAGGTADDTLTAGKLAPGNTYAAAGTVRSVEVPVSLTGISYKGLSAGPGEIWANVGHGEMV